MRPYSAIQSTLSRSDIRRSRSQSVILKRGQNVRYRPWVFMEHGAIMAASVLNSEEAVEMSVFVVSVFVRLREFARRHGEIVRRLDVLKEKVDGHDKNLRQMPQALRALLDRGRSTGRSIGFKSD